MEIFLFLEWNRILSITLKLTVSGLSEMELSFPQQLLCCALHW